MSERSVTTPIGAALFAMVANRALNPSLKLSIEQWSEEKVYLGNRETSQVQHFYRAMDFLLERTESVQKEVLWSTAAPHC